MQELSNLLDVEFTSKKIYTELSDKLKEVASTSWDELSPLLLEFASKLANLQVEKIKGQKVTTDLDIAYLTNVSLPSIERIIRGRVEDTVNDLWDYVKAVVEGVIEQSVKLATIAVKAYIGGVV